ncbi:hypothetical protein L2E82_25570 [Cichorium intybus]|uniref:Uncharacterized protein n=1 Tax=Cichorium intybus TaxID=13427 RepID=A0ACB9E4A4_CICIN|nr:hypothetical protein L2E82_25570 [Cichorium intybus]
MISAFKLHVLIRVYLIHRKTSTIYDTESLHPGLPVRSLFFIAKFPLKAIVPEEVPNFKKPIYQSEKVFNQEATGYGGTVPRREVCLSLVFAMVGCTYAAVPLYRRFCQATGYGGTVQRRKTVEEKIARHAQDGTATNRCVISRIQ